MKKSSIIIGVVFIVLGLALMSGVFVAFGFDFSKLDTAEYETNTYSLSESFSNIEIISKETDIEIKPSADGETKIVLVEKAKAKHTVSVQDGTLKISVNDEREWQDYININIKHLSMTVYVPSEQYERLKIENRTGNVNIENIKAYNIDISVSTGDTELKDVDCKNLVIKGSTGDTVLKDVVATEKLTVERSTGNIQFDNSDAATITIKTTTGSVTGTLRTAKIFIAKTFTGKISVPETLTGGKCEITTSTGDIKIELIG